MPLKHEQNPWQPRSALILGHGYTGRALADLLRRESWRVFTTSRSLGSDIRFDLNAQSTWLDLPHVECVFWLFAPRDPEKIAKFSEFLSTIARTLVVVGTTGSLVPEDGVVNEMSKMDGSTRARCDEILLRHGAILVHAAGIYGPGRNPMDWLARGRVGVSDKRLNVIHVEDLARLLVLASQCPKGSRFVASDGHAYTWRALADHWTDTYGLQLPTAQASKRTSKLVDPRATWEMLGTRPNHMDVIQGVASILSDDAPPGADQLDGPRMNRGF